MGILLFIIAVVFTTFFTILWIPYSIIYHLVKFKWKTGARNIDRYFYQLAIIVDIFGNESLQTLFNKIMIKKGIPYYPFGDDKRNTISYAIAKNDKLESTSKFGAFWGKFLNAVDKNHLQKALDYKQQRDIEAVQRLQAQGYVIVFQKPKSLHGEEEHNNID